MVIDKNFDGLKYNECLNYYKYDGDIICKERLDIRISIVVSGSINAGKWITAGKWIEAGK